MTIGKSYGQRNRDVPNEAEQQAMAERKHYEYMRAQQIQGIVGVGHLPSASDRMTGDMSPLDEDSRPIELALHRMLSTVNALTQSVSALEERTVYIRRAVPPPQIANTAVPSPTVPMVGALDNIDEQLSSLLGRVGFILDTLAV